MRFIVIAAGPGERWGEHTGVPKHLVEIEGERLLDRTCRQFRPHGDVFVAGHDERYQTPWSILFKAGKYLTPEWGGADKFLSSASLWNQNGRTVVLYGDVWFSKEAVDTIVDFREKEWQLFGRFGPSEVTGTPWGECFAQSFHTEHIEEHYAKLREMAKMEGKTGGWVHYRMMQGMEPLAHRRGPRFTEIDDWTDDFDFPEDYDRWGERRGFAPQVPP